MLVLSRRKDERIVIGPNVEVVVIQIQGNRVKLGISAPDKVSIRRERPLREEQHDQTVELVRSGRQASVQLLARRR